MIPGLIEPDEHRGTLAGSIASFQSGGGQPVSRDELGFRLVEAFAFEQRATESHARDGQV